MPPFPDLLAIIVILGVPIALFAGLIVAASAVGADFSTGAMSNWLSFIPRRGQVFWSRAVVTLIVVAVLGALVLALSIASVTLFAYLWHGAAYLTGWHDMARAFARAVGLIAGASLLGLAFAFLTRRTIAVLGIVMGYVVLRVVSLSFGSFPWFGKVEPWLPDRNLSAVLEGKTSYFIYPPPNDPNGEAIERWIGWEQGLIYLGVGLVAAMIVSLVSFLRRDVT